MLHQFSARRDKPQCIFKRENSGKTGRDIFTDAVADHHIGLDAPLHPKRSQRVFNYKKSRLSQSSLIDRIIIRSRVAAAEDHVSQVGSKHRIENSRASIDGLAKSFFLFVQPASHAPVLRALSGKHEDHRSIARLFDIHGRKRALSLFQGGYRFFGAAANDCAPVPENRPPKLKSVGSVGKGRSIRFTNHRQQVVRCRFEGRRASRRDQQQLLRTALAGIFARGRFFKNDVSVCAAHAKRADARAPRRCVAGPVFEPGGYIKRRLGKID